MTEIEQDIKDAKSYAEGGPALSRKAVGRIILAMELDNVAAENIYSELVALHRLVMDLVDEDPCDLDHHGYCQAHNWFSVKTCPHKRAKDLGIS